VGNGLITFHLYTHVRLQIQDVLENRSHESFVDTVFNMTALNERRIDDIIHRFKNIWYRFFAVIKPDDSSGSD
jgi:hypothetical protein